MEKLRKACVLDKECSMRSCFLTIILAYAQNEDLKNLGYINFSTTAPKFRQLVKRGIWNKKTAYYL